MKPVRIQKYEAREGEYFRLYQRADGTFGLYVSSLWWVPADLRGRRFTDTYETLLGTCRYLTDIAPHWRFLTAVEIAASGVSAGGE